MVPFKGDAIVKDPLFLLVFLFAVCVSVCVLLSFLSGGNIDMATLFSNSFIPTSFFFFFLADHIWASKEIDEKGGSCGNCHRLHWPSIRPSSHPWVDPFIHFHRRSYPSFLLSTKRIPSDRRVRQKNRKIKETHIPSQCGILFSPLILDFSVCISSSSRPPRRAPPDRKSISPLRKNPKKIKQTALSFVLSTGNL